MSICINPDRTSCEGCPGRFRICKVISKSLDLETDQIRQLTKLVNSDPRIFEYYLAHGNGHLDKFAHMLLSYNEEEFNMFKLSIRIEDAA